MLITRSELGDILNEQIDILSQVNLSIQIIHKKILNYPDNPDRNFVRPDNQTVQWYGQANVDGWKTHARIREAINSIHGFPRARFFRKPIKWGEGLNLARDRSHWKWENTFSNRVGAGQDVMYSHIISGFIGYLIGAGTHNSYLGWAIATALPTLVWQAGKAIRYWAEINPTFENAKAWAFLVFNTEARTKFAEISQAAKDFAPLIENLPCGFDLSQLRQLYVDLCRASSSETFYTPTMDLTGPMAVNLLQLQIKDQKFRQSLIVCAKENDLKAEIAMLPITSQRKQNMLKILEIADEKWYDMLPNALRDLRPNQEEMVFLSRYQPLEKALINQLDLVEYRQLAALPAPDIATSSAEPLQNKDMAVHYVNAL